MQVCVPSPAGTSTCVSSVVAACAFVLVPSEIHLVAVVLAGEVLHGRHDRRGDVVILIVIGTGAAIAVPLCGGADPRMAVIGDGIHARGHNEGEYQCDHGDCGHCERTDDDGFHPCLGAAGVGCVIRAVRVLA